MGLSVFGRELNGPGELGARAFQVPLLAKD